MKKLLRYVETPTKVIIREKIYFEEIISYLSDIDCKKYILVTSDTPYKLFKEKIIEAPANIFFVENGGFEDVRKIVEKTAYANIESIVGIGGGKVIDVSKVVASQIGIPFVAIPTTVSHDGISSPVASFRKREKPVSIMARPPSAVFVDISVLKTCPKRFVASGYGDLLANITAIKDWKLADEKGKDEFDELAGIISLSAVRYILNEEKNLHSLVRGLILSGLSMSIAGSSRPASGSEHKFSHALDYKEYGNGLHGEQVAIGSIIMEYLYEKHYNDGDWQMLKRIMENVGLPLTLKEIGVTKEQALEALKYARSIRSERYTILEDLNPTEKDLEIALKETKLI